MMSSDGTAMTLKKLLGEVEGLLKGPTVGTELARRGVNTSIALLAVQGVSAYLEGHKREAAEDLASAAEEIQARLVP
jgi:hypothetical protein